MHSRRFFQAIVEEFNESSVVVVRLHQQVVVTALLLRHGDVLSSVYAGSHPDYLQTKPNNFLYWEAIKYGIATGARYFDFGRSLAGSGAAKFKEAFGPDKVALHYCYYLRRRSEIPRINQGNPRFRFAQAVWRRFPLRLTTLLGPSFIKNVP